MKTTKIEWTDKTWNPITGCTKISPGCQNCYAETMCRRLCAMKQAKYSNAFKLTLHENTLHDPLMWKGSCNIFVCSMSDLFHKDVPFDFLDKIFDTIVNTPNHNYQILTKRPHIMREYFSIRKIPSNVWIGTTVECAEVKNRIDFIRDLNASIKFLSCEPLLNDLGKLNLDGIDWVIVGGESGHKARPMKQEWIFSIKEQVENSNAAFFFKQWGTWGSDGVKRSKHANGKVIDGKIYQDMPTIRK